MASHTDLDFDSVARIGLLFLDGDSLEDVLLDKYGHPDYDFDKFNNCKITVMRIEKINPTLSLTAVLWQRRPDDPCFAVPVVAGNALPREGYGISPIPAPMERAFSGDFGPVLAREGDSVSRYYPVKNSDAEIVGVLELLSTHKERNDI